MFFHWLYGKGFNRYPNVGVLFVREKRMNCLKSYAFRHWKPLISCLSLVRFHNQLLQVNYQMKYLMSFSGTKFACQLHSFKEYPVWINGVNRTAYDIHRIVPKLFVIARKYFQSLNRGTLNYKLKSLQSIMRCYWWIRGTRRSRHILSRCVH